MKAIVATAYGSPNVLQLKEVQKPVPGDREVLIRIHATTVTTGDCEVRSFKMPLFIWLPMRLFIGLTKPRKGILGQEFAGEIESVGKQVRRFKQGDPVFGMTSIGLGAHAEYISLPEAGMLAIKPSTLTYEDAATIPVGGLVALSSLRKAHIQPGEKVLINGAGGSIGTLAIQLAKHFGAHVIAVDSTGKLEMMRSIGADQVIDYTEADFTQSGETYDVILDVVGKISFSRMINALKPGGRYLMANPRVMSMLRGRWTSMTSSRKVIIALGGETVDDLVFLKALFETDKLKSVIDRRYPLEETVEAHRYVETGAKNGSVVITVAQN